VPIERINLAVPLENRNDNDLKDSLVWNMLYESHEHGTRLVKRPGCNAKFQTPSAIGQAQGITSWNNYLMYITNNNVIGATMSAAYLFGNLSTSIPNKNISFLNTSADTYLVFNDQANLYYIPKATSVLTNPGTTVTATSITWNGGNQRPRYTVAPGVHYSAAVGAGAVGTAVLGVNGVVTSITQNNVGAGYTAGPPTVTIDPPTVTNPVIAISWLGILAPGQATFSWYLFTTLTSGGTGYTQAPLFNVTGTAYSLYNGLLSPAKLASWQTTINTTGTITSIQYLGLGAGPGWSDPIGNSGPPTLDMSATPAPYTYAISLEGPMALAPQATAVMGSNIPGPYAYGICSLDGYIFIMNSQGSIYQSTNPDDPTLFEAINVIRAESDPDPGVAIARHLNYIVAFGTYSMDVFYNAGNPTGSILNVNKAAKLEIGCACGPSVVTAEQTVIWCGQTKTGGKSIYLMDGLTPVKVSNRHVEKYLNSPRLLNNVYAYCVKISGHTLYVLTLIDAGTTLVYDLDEKSWTKWSSLNSDGSETYFKFSHCVSDLGVYNGNFLLHEKNSLVSELRPDIYGDTFDNLNVVTPVLNSIGILVITPLHDSGTKKRKFYSRVEVIGDTLDSFMGNLYLSHSDNDYNSFSYGRVVDMSRMRPALYQNGSSRRRAWQITSQDWSPFRLEALEIESEIGETGQ
jgi:hypothetical protein